MSRYSLCQAVFKKSSYFCCYVSLDSVNYFWRTTGRLAGTKQELAASAVLAPGLFRFKQHRRANSRPWNI